MDLFNKVPFKFKTRRYASIDTYHNRSYICPTPTNDGDIKKWIFNVKSHPVPPQKAKVLADLVTWPKLIIKKLTPEEVQELSLPPAEAAKL